MNNNHNRIKELLPLYIDNELSEKDEADVLEHLAECDTCQNDLNMLMEIQSAIKLDMVPLPEGFHEATMARIEQEAHPAKKSSRFDYRRYIHVASLVLLVAIIGTIGFRLGDTGTDRNDSMVMSGSMMDEGADNGSAENEMTYKAQLNERSIQETEESTAADPEITAFSADSALEDSTLELEDDRAQEDSIQEDTTQEDAMVADDQVADAADGGEFDSDGSVDSESPEVRVEMTEDSSADSTHSGTNSAAQMNPDVIVDDSENESLGNLLWIFIPLGLSVLIGITYVYRQRSKKKEN